jgi:putative membrane protein
MGAGWGYWGWGWWFWVFWAVIFVLAIWLIASAASAGQRTMLPEEQILRARYARGEISKEQFDRMLGDLRRSRAA